MGLDISAYSKLKPVAHTNDALGDDTVRLMDNTNFPGRAAPFTDGHHAYGEAMDVFSMGYTRYTRWREWLAKLAGYPALNTGAGAHPHSRGAWAQRDGPFWELINFADNEGTIGTVACVKLLKDFNEFEQRAMDNSSGPEFDHYVDLHNGLRLAVDGGCLKFS
jgi:hypothetical protein